jgi:hypothetical protein
MNYKNVSRKVKGIVGRTLSQQDLLDRIIVRKNNTLFVYGVYMIDEEGEMFRLQSEYSDTTLWFTHVKSAIAWCIAQKHSRFNLAREIRFYDQKLGFKQTDIDMLSVQLTVPDLHCDVRAVMYTKLKEYVNSRQVYKRQLLACVESAKAIKLHLESSR